MISLASPFPSIGATVTYHRPTDEGAVRVKARVSRFMTRGEKRLYTLTADDCEFGAELTLEDGELRIRPDGWVGRSLPVSVRRPT